MNFIKRNLPRFGVHALACAALCFIASTATAQPYQTNNFGTVTNGPQFGAYLPNSSVIPPTQPSRTIATQLASGINAGWSVTSGDGTVTNTFSTNYVYSAAPFVTVTMLGTTGNGGTNTPVITSVTTTNFVFKVGAISGVTNHWHAVGH